MVKSVKKIQAGGDILWQALTDKSKMKEWYFDIPDFELMEGLTFNFFEPGGKNKFHHRCVIHEITPGKKFSHTWAYPDYSKGETMVTWLLDEADGGTTVTVLHEGIENILDGGPDFAVENFQMGWDGFLIALKNYVHGIRRKTYQVEINAEPQQVWEAIWDKENYKQWTAAFTEGSYYEGELKNGGRIHFLNPGREGIYSDLLMFNPYRLAVVQHLGEIKAGQEQAISEQVEKWTGSMEIYQLIADGGTTTLRVEVDQEPENEAFFDEKFPLALQNIKTIAEAL